MEMSTPRYLALASSNACSRRESNTYLFQIRTILEQPWMWTYSHTLPRQTKHLWWRCLFRDYTLLHAWTSSPSHFWPPLYLSRVNWVEVNIAHIWLLHVLKGSRPLNLVPPSNSFPTRGLRKAIPCVMPLTGLTAESCTDANYFRWLKGQCRIRRGGTSPNGKRTAGWCCVKAPWLQTRTKRHLRTLASTNSSTPITSGSTLKNCRYIAYTISCDHPSHRFVTEESTQLKLNTILRVMISLCFSYLYWRVGVCHSVSSCLQQTLKSSNGVLQLPLIKNKKTVNPRDSSSPAVFQLETAMGSAIECFDDAGAVVVPRDRFAPVKTTNDLFALRSDAYKVRHCPMRSKEESKAHSMASASDTLAFIALADSLIWGSASLYFWRAVRITTIKAHASAYKNVHALNSTRSLLSTKLRKRVLECRGMSYGSPTETKFNLNYLYSHCRTTSPKKPSPISSARRCGVRNRQSFQVW